MKKIKRIKYPREPRSKSYLPHGGIGRSHTEASTEVLEGQVQGMPASAGEERAVRGATKHPNVEEVHFRLAVGGARNTPGWKELDLLVGTKGGLYYAIEVDSAFTHMTKKENADVLHDAIVLKELDYLNIYPKVIHLDIDHDLSNQAMADATMRRLF